MTKKKKNGVSSVAFPSVGPMRANMSSLFYPGISQGAKN